MRYGSLVTGAPAARVAAQLDDLLRDLATREHVPAMAWRQRHPDRAASGLISSVANMVQGLGS